MEIETPVILAHEIEDSTGIFGISGGLNTPTLPRYATDQQSAGTQPESSSVQ